MFEISVLSHDVFSVYTVYPKKYTHGFVVLCFVVVMQSFIMISHEVFIHIHQGCFAGTGAIVRLPQCQWSKPDGYGKISQCITSTKHSKAKTVCIFHGIYCRSVDSDNDKKEQRIRLQDMAVYSMKIIRYVGGCKKCLDSACQVPGRYVAFSSYTLVLFMFIVHIHWLY